MQSAVHECGTSSTDMSWAQDVATVWRKATLRLGQARLGWRWQPHEVKGSPRTQHTAHTAHTIYTASPPIHTPGVACPGTNMTALNSTSPSALKWEWARGVSHSFCSQREVAGGLGLVQGHGGRARSSQSAVTRHRQRWQRLCGHARLLLNSSMSCVPC